MLAAAAAPAFPEEHDESALGAVLAAFNAAAVEEAPALGAAGVLAEQDASSQQSKRIVRLVTRCAAALFIVTGGGVAVASAGILPDPIQSLAHHVFGGLGVPAPKHGVSPSAPRTQDPGSVPTSPSTPIAPGAGAPAGTVPHTTATPSPGATTGADTVAPPTSSIPPAQDTPTPISSPAASPANAWATARQRGARRCTNNAGAAAGNGNSAFSASRCAR